MQKTIFIKNIFTSKRSLFQEHINDVTSQIDSLTGRKNTPSTATQRKRLIATHIVIEGLYRCYCSQSELIGLAVPHNPAAYNQNDKSKISRIGYKIIRSVIDSMVKLGWVNKKRGFWNADFGGETTELRPSGELLEAFKNVGITWQELEPINDVIILRNYDPSTKKKYNQPIPKSDYVRAMESNVKKINKFLCKQCICLMISNERYHKLASQLISSQKNARHEFSQQEQFPRYIDFSMVQLNRIFSRSNMRLGGRFYGGWWQFIPKEYRVHITINYLPTIEVDYSGLHPLMIYHLEELTPPNGDMYDIGIWATEQQKKIKRPLIKKFFNAIINDESGNYRMSKEDLNIIGMTNKQLRDLIYQKHHQIKHRFNSGYGLKLQYEDSQIAERVMLILMEQKITCLPIHDSFIVPYMHKSELVEAMIRVYKEKFGKDVSTKSTFLFDLDENGTPIYQPEFPMPMMKMNLSNEIAHLDRNALYKMHEDSIHNSFCNSWSINEKKRPSNRL